MVATIQLREAIDRGEAAEPNYEQLYEVQFDLDAAEPCQRRTWELLTNAQREAVIQLGLTLGGDAEEQRQEVDAFLRTLGVVPSHSFTGRTSIPQRSQPTSSPPTLGEASSWSWATSTDDRSPAKAAQMARLYEHYAPRLAAARSALGWRVLVDALERKLGRNPEPYAAWFIQETSAEVTVVSLDTDELRCKADPSGVADAGRLAAQRHSLREIERRTGIAHSVLHRILRRG